MKKTICIGSRGSRLALTQAQWVGTKIQEKFSDFSISYETITTQGDINQKDSFDKVGTKGIFVKEIEEALLAKKIDLAIHSLKDMPQMLPAGLILGPTPLREDPSDAWISRFGEVIGELPKGSIVGTSSPRRAAQLKYLYRGRHYQIQPFRGNVDTRLKKIQDGQVDATLLATAGLKRLGMAGEISQILDPEKFLPSPTQGCLGLEYRAEDLYLFELLKEIHDAPSDKVAKAERAFLLGFGGDCQLPVGVYTSLSKNQIKMKARLFHPSGDEMVEAEQSGSDELCELLGAQLAERLLYNGGSDMMYRIDKGLE